MTNRTMKTEKVGPFQPVKLTKGGTTVVARRRKTLTQLKSQGWKPVAEKASPRLNVAEVLDQVAGDPEKAQAALDLEQSNAKPRATLVEKLRTIVGGEA